MVENYSEINDLVLGRAIKFGVDNRWGTDKLGEFGCFGEPKMPELYFVA
jgi:hypothetical protein